MVELHIPSLLYHDVSAEPMPGMAHWTVTPAEFQAHLAVIAASGRTALSVSELAAALGGLRDLPSDPVVVSFDDGYRSWPAVAEQLGSAGVTSCSMYVTTGHLDRPGHLTAAQLQSLPDWVDVGSHGVSHARLDELGGPDLRTELHDSRAYIEDLLGRPCVSVAYPHGNHSKAVKVAAREAGYQNAAAVKNALSHPNDDLFALARWTVTSGTGAREIREILAGRGAPLAWRSERWRTRVSRWQRRAARRIGLR